MMLRKFVIEFSRYRKTMVLKLGMVTTKKTVVTTDAPHLT